MYIENSQLKFTVSPIEKSTPTGLLLLKGSKTFNVPYKVSIAGPTNTSFSQDIKVREANKKTIFLIIESIFKILFELI